MKPLITMLIVIAVLTLMWSAAAVKLTTQAKQSARVIAITDNIYAAAAEGITIDQTTTLWGTPKEVTEHKGHTISETKCLWVDKQNTPCYAYFRDGKLHRKHR